MYFVHSFRAVPQPANADWVLATSDYGGEFVSALKRGEARARAPDLKACPGSGLALEVANKWALAAISEMWWPSFFVNKQGGAGRIRRSYCN